MTICKYIHVYHCLLIKCVFNKTEKRYLMPNAESAPQFIAVSLHLRGYGNGV